MIRKHNRTILLGCLFAGPLLLSFAHAEDTLAGLQTDIVAAKQKQQAFAAQAETSQIQQDAQALIDDMRTNPDKYRGAGADQGPLPMPVFETGEEKAVVPVTKSTDIAPAVEIEEADRSIPDSPAKKQWFWPPKFGFGYSKNTGDQLSESDMLYRVAVSDKKLTLDECTQIGQAASPDLKAKKKVVEVAEAKLMEAKRAMFPTIQGVYERNGGKIPGAAGSRFYKGENRKINITQPIWYGGELVNTVKQAEENLKVSKTEYEKARNDAIHTVRIAYWGLVKAKYHAQYQAELHEKTAKIREVAFKQHEAKLLSEIDFLNVESQHNQVLFQFESSQNDVLSAEVVLRQVLDLEEREPMPVEIKLEFRKAQLDFEELLRSSLTNSADIRIKGYVVEAAKYGILIYKGKEKPHFDFRGSYGMLGEAFHDTEAFEDGKADNDLEKEWYMGIHGTVPLGPNSVQYDQIKHKYGPTALALTGSEDWRHHVEFNLFDRFSAITDEKTAQSALLEAEAEYQRVKNDITLKLRDDYYTLQRAVIQIDSSVSKMKYQEKQTKILEYLVSVQEAAPASVMENLIENVQDRFAFVQAVTDYNISLSSLSVSIGDPYYFEK